MSWDIHSLLAGSGIPAGDGVAGSRRCEGRGPSGGLAASLTAAAGGLSQQRCFSPDALAEVSGEGAVMTTLDVVPKKKPEPSAEETAAKELVRLGREHGLSLTGPGG